MENGSRELDLYGGYTGTAGALGYNVSATYYLYPGARIAAMVRLLRIFRMDDYL